jgi:hypothetical protein
MQEGYLIAAIYRRYLDSSVHLAYLLLRMLERWARTKGEMYVRKTKKAKRKSKKGATPALGSV